jgi:hypothetical protein
MNAPTAPSRAPWCACAISRQVNDARVSLDRAGARPPHILPALRLQSASSVAVSGRDVIRNLEAAAGPRPSGAVLVLVDLAHCAYCESLEGDLRGSRLLRPVEVPVWLHVGRPVNVYGKPVDWPVCGELAHCGGRGCA